jgi:phosphohistidine phosphatase
MTLYLLRHAQAGEHVAGPREDDARRLTAQGRKRMAQAAVGLRHLGIKLDAILTSPLPRASETAEIVAKSYHGRPRPEVLETLAHRFPPAEAAAALSSHRAHANLMVVGHEPQLSELISIFLTGGPEGVPLQLKKGGCAALEFNPGLEPGRGELLWILTQRQLRQLAK